MVAFSDLIASIGGALVSVATVLWDMQARSARMGWVAGIDGARIGIVARAVLEGRTVLVHRMVLVMMLFVTRERSAVDVFVDALAHCVEVSQEFGDGQWSRHSVFAVVAPVGAREEIVVKEPALGFLRMMHDGCGGRYASCRPLFLVRKFSVRDGFRVAGLDVAACAGGSTDIRSIRLAVVAGRHGNADSPRAHSDHARGGIVEARAVGLYGAFASPRDRSAQASIRLEITRFGGTRVVVVAVAGGLAAVGDRGIAAVSGSANV